MSETSFASVLTRLWPNGDQKIPSLRAGMIETAGNTFQRYGINSPLLMAHVMAQISHECGAGHDVVENLNYSAGRMMQVWPSRFPTTATAQPYAGNPRALANKVYNGRMDNAPGSDDGFNFRGRGASQTTGREGYARLAKSTGLDVLNHPDLVNDPKHFLECGVADFILCGCLPYAKADDILNVTRRLNGGTVGLPQRQAWLAKWKAALGAGPVIFAPAGSAKASLLDSPAVNPRSLTGLDEPEPEPAPAAPPVAPVAIDAPAPKPAHPNAQPVPTVSVDPDLLDVQTRLKARRYSPGLVDGFWGSGTRGALSGFMNDRGMTAHVPISLDEFHDIAEDVRAELLKAETEHQPDGSVGWYRPVSQARANAEPAIVKELAPEVVQATQGRTLTIWGAIGTAFTGIYKTFSDSISNAWDFIFDHKDDIPTDPSYLQTAWGYVTSLPSEVWFFVGAAGFVFIAVKMHGVVKKINEDVKTGARQ